MLRLAQDSICLSPQGLLAWPEIGKVGSLRADEEGERMSDRPESEQSNELERQQLGLDVPLTAEEIANKKFLSAFRGYAKWEVDQFPA